MFGEGSLRLALTAIDTVIGPYWPLRTFGDWRVVGVVDHQKAASIIAARATIFHVSPTGSDQNNISRHPKLAPISCATQKAARIQRRSSRASRLF